MKKITLIPLLTLLFILITGTSNANPYSGLSSSEIFSRVADKAYKQSVEAVHKLDEKNKNYQQMIDESIASWPDICPCPYSKNDRGMICGNMSAWSQSEEYKPLCYKSDVERIFNGY